MWGAANRQDLAVLQGHTGDVSDLAFTADGRSLVSVSQSGRFGYSEDGTVRLWEVGRQAGGVRAARPHQLRLSGGVQPGRTMDRLGELGQHGALVGRT